MREPGTGTSVPHLLAPVPGGEPRGGQRSPIPFLMFWFVIPLIVLLVLEKLGLAQRVEVWIGRLFG